MMRLRMMLLVLCVLSLSATLAVPADAQLTVQSRLDIWGAPHFQAWPNGYFIWRDEAGVHIRWTSAFQETHQFRGQATVNGQIASFTPLVYSDQSARPDRLRRRGNTITWNASNSGGGEGFDFTVTPNDVVQFTLRVDGRMASREEIFLGARAYHPSANPFSLAIQTAPGPGRPGYPGRPGAGYPGRPQTDIWGAPRFQTWPTGYYVWMDELGSHVRWTSAQRETHQFRGEATVRAGLATFSPAYPGRTPVRRQGNVISWSGSYSAGTDGFDFTPNSVDGDMVQLSLFIDGRIAGQGEIFLGTQGVHPRENPFWIRQ